MYQQQHFLELLDKIRLTFPLLYRIDLSHAILLEQLHFYQDSWKCDVSYTERMSLQMSNS